MHKIANLANQVLRWKGRKEADPLAIHMVYEDSKVVIEALVNDDRKTIDSFTVGVKMSENRNDKEQPFFLKISGRGDLTTVFYGKDFAYYYRPGRWEKYLESLAAEYVRLQQEHMKLNNAPIDDSKLFPDSPVSPDE